MKFIKIRLMPKKRKKPKYDKELILMAKKLAALPFNKEGTDKTFVFRVQWQWNYILSNIKGPYDYKHLR